MPDERIDALRPAVPLTKPPRRTITRAELRRLVRYWAGLLKEAGLAPEEVLIAVKALVRETIVPRYERYADGEKDDVPRIAFVRDAAQWCIDAYVEGPADE